MSQGPSQPTPPTQTSAAAPDATAVDSIPHLPGHVDEVRRARSEDCVRLLNDVEGIRQRRQRDSVRLLQELTPQLRAARMVERELDRHLARRFNVFRYLRNDELGLSLIIAELLDPTVKHGQGTTFLDAMLELLGLPYRYTDTDNIRIARERRIPGPRFIDVTVDIPTDDGLFCLAFENKPYANDQPGQCRDYLRFLEKRYGKRCLLVYLPPRYRMPDKSSLSTADHERWKNHFRVLPYLADDAPLGDDDPSDGDGAALLQTDSGEDDDVFAGDDATDHASAAAQDDAAVGDGASLADWFGTCCKLCDAERLRWFLREAQLFCQHHIGGSTMTDSEARYIHVYLDENPRHLHAAFAVTRAWPAVKHDVCRRFLGHLRDRVDKRLCEEMPKIRGDLQVDCHYADDKKWSTQLRLGRRIMMQAGGPGPKKWIWGVRNPNPETLREELLVALKRRGLDLPLSSDGWPQYEDLPRYGYWNRRVPELVQELADGGGKITDYYVNGLLNIAEKAIPAFDEVEQR